MGTVSMNSVHFYDPSSKVPSFSARCAAALQKHSRSAGKAGKQDDPANNDHIAADEDDDFPSLKYVLHPTQRSEDSIETPTNSSLIAQETNKTSLPNGGGFSMPTQLSLSGFLNGSKDQPVILDDNDDNDGDNDSNNTSSGSIPNSLDPDGIGRELGQPPTSPYSSLRRSSSRDPSLHHSVASDDQSLKGQDSQQDDGFISCQMLEQPSCPTLILSDDEDYETQKCQQQQELGEDGEQEACGSDTSSNSDADDEDDHLQNNNRSEGLQSIKQHQLSPFYNPVIRRSCKRRLQHFN